ncbi:hypothetical protein LXL04_028307 [Taraxacum kok-saghyz]
MRGVTSSSPTCHPANTSSSSLVVNPTTTPKPVVPFTRLSPEGPPKMTCQRDTFPMPCDVICPNLVIDLNHAPFTIPYFILLVEGADLILGLAWLRTVWPILVDFSIPQLTFNSGPNTITLRGKPIRFHPHLKTLIAKESVSSFHAVYFRLQPPLAVTLPPQPHHLDPNIANILHTYQTVFDASNSLPLIAHKIIISQPFPLPPYECKTLPLSSLQKTSDVNSHLRDVERRDYQI